jgi:hypothetical protein
MEVDTTPHITASDWSEDGLMIFFADGRSAFYSYYLLYSIIERAEPSAPSESGEEKPAGGWPKKQ